MVFSATSRSFHWLWLPPEGFRPTAPHLFLHRLWIFTSVVPWFFLPCHVQGFAVNIMVYYWRMGEDLNLSGVPTVFPISPLCEPTYFTLIPSIYSLFSRTAAGSVLTSLRTYSECFSAEKPKHEMFVKTPKYQCKKIIFSRFFSGSSPYLPDSSTTRPIPLPTLPLAYISPSSCAA